MLIVRLFVGDRLVRVAGAEDRAKAALLTASMGRRWRHHASLLGVELRHEVKEVPAIRVPLGVPLRDIKRRVFAAALDLCNGSPALTAQILGVSRRTVYNYLAEQKAGGASAQAVA